MRTNVESYLRFLDQGDLIILIDGRIFKRIAGSNRFFLRGLGLGLDVCHDDRFDDVDIDVIMIFTVMKIMIGRLNKILFLHADVLQLAGHAIGTSAENERNVMMGILLFWKRRLPHGGSHDDG